MASFLFGQIFSRLFDTNFDSSDFDFGLEPELLPELPRPQQETLANASLWRLLCVFMTKLWEFILGVAENSTVSFFYDVTIITTICYFFCTGSKKGGQPKRLGHCPQFIVHSKINQSMYAILIPKETRNQPNTKNSNQHQKNSDPAKTSTQGSSRIA